MNKSTLTFFGKIILFVWLFLWFIRIFPYFFNDVPFGYDHWMYRLVFMDYANLLPFHNFDSLPLRINSNYPPFIWYIWNIIHLLGFNIDMVLTFWVWVLSVLAGFFVYIYLKKYWTNFAILWFLFYEISIIQYQVFWRGYIKQLFWIIFFLASLYFIQKQRYSLLTLMITATFLVQRPTWLYLFLLILIYSIYLFFKWSFDKKLFISLVISSLVALIFYLPLFDTLVLPMLNPIFTLVNQSQSWTFFSRGEYWIYNIIYFVFSIIWFLLMINNRDRSLLFWWYALWLVWIWFWFFFYNRMYAVFDLFVIWSLVYFLRYIYDNNAKYYYWLLTTIIVLQMAIYSYYSHVMSFPLISKQELDILKIISIIVPDDAYIMTTSKRYSAFVAWYANKKTIAPWLFDNNIWSQEQRDSWHRLDPNQKCDKLKDYEALTNKKLYIWLWENQPYENILSWYCVQTVFNWSKYVFIKINF